MSKNPDNNNNMLPIATRGNEVEIMAQPKLAAEAIDIAKPIRLQTIGERPSEPSFIPSLEVNGTSFDLSLFSMT
jgi:hypothetical protein